MRRSESHLCSSVACSSRAVEGRRSLAGHILILLCLALVAADARAFCDAIHPVPEFYVGDVASDSACTHNDIQSAIDSATCSYGTKIFITREHTYTTQSLSINNKNVTLIGRGDGINCGPVTIGICDPIIGCPPPPTAPLVIIGGTNGASVVTINGTSNVTLRYLDITNVGNNANGNGGGVDFDGSGSLTLDTSWVANSHATNGGGVYFNGTGASPSIFNVLAHSEIFSNTADGDGGGILVAGNSVLNVLQSDILIEFNHAPGGDGGGIAVIGPATAYVGSPGVTGVSGQIGVVNNNTAAYGGGIAVVSGSDDNERAVVRLFTTDGTNPVEIASNSASHTGGGIYLKGYTNALPIISNYAYLCAWDFRITDNLAAEGAAIYGDVDSGVDDVGSIVELGSCYLAGGTLPTDLGAMACTNSTLCNSIDANEATDPAQGSAILIQDNGSLNANRLAMRNNHVAHAIRIVGDSTSAYLSNCLLADNTIAGELIYLAGNVTPLTIEACTFANNTIGASHVIHTESDMSINDSIIAEPDTLALDYSGIPASLVVHYVVSNDVTTLGGVAPGVIQGTPTFVDLAGGDYHLRAGFLGVDLAPVPSGFDRTQGVDLDGNPRNIDLPSIINAYGPRDIGAYEIQNLFRECGTTDSVFCNGFNY